MDSLSLAPLSVPGQPFQFGCNFVGHDPICVMDSMQLAFRILELHATGHSTIKSVPHCCQWTVIAGSIEEEEIGKGKSCECFDLDENKW